MIYKRFFFGAFLGCITLFTFTISHSFFSDQSVSSQNTFTAAAVFPTQTPTITPTATPTPTLHLVINEVFEASNNDDEWIELFNPTSGEVNVSGWSISDNTETDTFPSVSPIPAGGYAVIVADPTNISPPGIIIQLSDSTIGFGLNESGDRAILRNASSEIIDQMNYGNDDSGIFTSPPAAPSPTQSLARTPNGFDSNQGSDWTPDDTPTIGTDNSL